MLHMVRAVLLEQYQYQLTAQIFMNNCLFVSLFVMLLPHVSALDDRLQVELSCTVLRPNINIINGVHK